MAKENGIPVEPSVVFEQQAFVPLQPKPGAFPS